MINHVVMSRCRFKDAELMQKYLNVSKKYFVPSIKSQKEKNFTVVIMVRKDDENYIKDFLELDFVAVYDLPTLVDYLIGNKATIQTRHDIDDYMSPNYVSKIQAIYKDAIDSHDKFLIQAQPVKLDTRTGYEKVMGRYHEKKTSMFLSLCQKEVTNHIQERKHGLMWEIAPRVFTLPEGYVKWVIHGDNISCKRGGAK